MSSPTAYLLPHLLTEQSAKKALFNYLAQGDFTDEDLVGEAQVLRCRKYYIPLHRFQGRYIAQYSALVGVDRMETYFETRRVQYGDWGADFYDEQVAKEREVTHWYPVTGNRAGEFDLYVYGGKDVTSQAQSLFEWIPASSGWRTVGEKEIATLDVEASHASFPASFAKRESALSSMMTADITASLAGDGVKDVRLSYSLEKNESLVFNPLYHIAFKYRQKTYDFWVHGSDAAQCTGDHLPVNQKTKENAGNVWWTPIILTIVVPIVAFKNHEHVTGSKLAIAGMAVLAAWIYASVKHRKIVDRSKASRENALARRLATLDQEPKARPKVAKPAARVAAQPPQPDRSAAAPVAVPLAEIKSVRTLDEPTSQDSRTLVLTNKVRRTPHVLVAKQ